MLDQAIDAIASPQLGLITSEQLHGLGVTQRQTDRRVRAGRLDPLFPGVFRLPGTVVCWEQDLLALVLCAGPLAAASHLAACVLWGIPGFKPGPLDAVRPHRETRRIGEGIMHGSRLLPEHHIARHLVIPVVIPERALIEACALVHPARAARAYDNALAMRLTNISRSIRVFEELQARGRPGIAVARAILGERGEGYIAPASDMEDRFLKFIRHAGLPEPERELNVGTDIEWVGRVEFVWREQRVLVECDPRRHHSALLDLRHDTQRRRRLTANGWIVIPVLWWDLKHNQAGLLRDLRDALNRR
jgi:hypothetical protein